MLTARSSRGSARAQVALAEGQQTDTPRGKHQTRGVSDRLGNPQPFVPEGTALGERPNSAWHQASQTREMHGGQEYLAEALVAPRPVEGCHGLPKAVDRPTIVALGMVGLAEVLVR